MNPTHPSSSFFFQMAPAHHQCLVSSSFCCCWLLLLRPACFQAAVRSHRNQKLHPFLLLLLLQGDAGTVRGTPL
uniref:Predicted protein n=1 Tax=Hordeum vulgare subsp. vulgare TaxID=112509 RepID=F2E8N9_HORVV|nr:predicted protein [Hordeum vulgare subsp. vulgare]